MASTVTVSTQVEVSSNEDHIPDSESDAVTSSAEWQVLISMQGSIRAKDGRGRCWQVSSNSKGGGEHEFAVSQNPVKSHTIAAIL